VGSGSGSLENGDENRAVAWAFGHPGCFAYGADPDAAYQAAPQAVEAYLDWVHSNGGTWLATDEIQVEWIDTWQVYVINENYDLVQEGYSINAWFLDDWKPLEREEIERGLQLLEWSRSDLLRCVQDLPSEVMQGRHPGERWGIEGILKHVANAEWWYLDRLDLGFPRQVLHDNVFERLTKVRNHLNSILPELAGSRRVVGTDGEFWSARKLLRRAVWHERDHTLHIQRLLEILE
jgi:hypothetical protein